MSTATLARLGDFLAGHRRAIRRVQWAMIALYALLVAVPPFLPAPAREAHLWSDLTLFAQFAFWGVWWPFVLVSMVLVGRTWCGIFCPEGALSEFASRRSLGRAVPRWITWRGWPFVAFVGTTVYGQTASVYQYPAPALVVLGGSTLAAIAVGLVWGRDKRVWCRYLCPVNGVFALLARLAPVAFRVDEAAWRRSQALGERPRAVDCAPLVPIRTMTGGAQCHMCGRCSGLRDAVRLEARLPAAEIVGGAAPGRWETALILYGLLGLAVGAFQWSASPWLVAAKQFLADYLVAHDVVWPLAATLPWWLLTNYPEANDVLTLLDGALLVGYMALSALLLGTVHLALLAGGVRVAGAFAWPRLHRLALALVPIAGCGIFLGLSAMTVTLLKGEGVPVGFAGPLRAALLGGALLWSVALAWRIAEGWTAGWRRLAVAGSVAACGGLAASGWALLFWIW